MYVQPNLSVQTEVYQLLYGFGICLGIRQVYVLFWAFSWFLIPPCQLRGFSVQLLLLTFTSSIYISWCITILYRDSKAEFSVVYYKSDFRISLLLILRKWASNNNSRYLIHPDLRTVINNLCRAKEAFCFKLPQQKCFQSFVWLGRGLLSSYSFSCLELTFVAMIFFLLSWVLCESVFL